MKTFLISLQRRPDRRAAALAQCKQAGIEPIVFNAIDGNSVRIPSTFKSSRGAYGCALSHAKVLRDCDTDMVFVLEDDVVFVDNFQQKLSIFLSQVPDDWQAIFIGGQHIDTPTLKGKCLVPGKRGIQRTHAYIARGEYIKTLADMFDTANEHIDHVWGYAQHQHKIYAPIIWLAGQGESFSDVSMSPRGERFWEAKQFTR